MFHKSYSQQAHLAGTKHMFQYLGHNCDMRTTQGKIYTFIGQPSHKLYEETEEEVANECGKDSNTNRSYFVVAPIIKSTRLILSLK